MNYLAHTHLSFGNPAWIVGNFLADAVKGHERLAEFPIEIQQGILIHRKIDEYTDEHPLVIQGKRRLYHKHGKYAAVIVDIFYDFVLANNWSTFCDISLDEFSKNAYTAFESYHSLMPTQVWSRLSNMIAHNWLAGYGTETALRFTFQKMAERVKFEHKMLEAPDDLLNNFELYNQEFLEFYPTLLNEISFFCAKNFTNT